MQYLQTHKGNRKGTLFLIDFMSTLFIAVGYACLTEFIVNSESELADPRKRKRKRFLPKHTLNSDAGSSEKISDNADHVEK